MGLSDQKVEEPCLTPRLSSPLLSSPRQVVHFSKYGLLDSDEEEDVPSKADPKKLKTMPPLPPSKLLQQLPPSQLQGALQAQVDGTAGVRPHL